jgi:hypothetical protein
MLLDARRRILSAFYGRFMMSRVRESPLPFSDIPNPEAEERFKEVDLIKILFYKDDGTPIPDLPALTMERDWLDVGVNWSDPNLFRLIVALQQYQSDVSAHECVFLDQHGRPVDITMVEEIEVDY